MAGKPATKEENTVGWGFHPNNNNTMPEVSWAYLPNNGNFALQNSYVCENLQSEHKVLTTATYEAKTRMNSAFSGEGVQTLSPARLSATLHILQKN